VLARLIGLGYGRSRKGDGQREDDDEKDRETLHFEFFLCVFGLASMTANGSPDRCLLLSEAEREPRCNPNQ
jgi:hypothetical protein